MSAWTRFEKEAKANSEMAYTRIFVYTNADFSVKMSSQ